MWAYFHFCAFVWLCFCAFSAFWCFLVLFLCVKSYKKIIKSLKLPTEFILLQALIFLIITIFFNNRNLFLIITIFFNNCNLFNYYNLWHCFCENNLKYKFYHLTHIFYCQNMIKIFFQFHMFLIFLLWILFIFVSNNFFIRHKNSDDWVCGRALLTSQNWTYWKITNTKREKGKKLQNVHNLLQPGFQIMT